MTLPLTLRMVRTGSVPPPSGEWLERLPSGVTLVDDEPFSTSGGLNFTGSRGSASGVTDSTAPYSPDKVVRFVYPSGDGQGFGTGYRTVTVPIDTTRLYGCFNIRLSSNYTVHPSNQKVVYLYHNTDQSLGSAVLGIRAGASESDLTAGTLRWNMEAQNGDGIRYANVGSGAIVRDVWYRIEWEAVMNTVVDTADGAWRLWVNGTLAMDYTNIAWATGSDPLVWRRSNLDPYYGGNTPGHTIPSECYLYSDHWTVYSSTARS
jgi:hypothetical protein